MSVKPPSPVDPQIAAAVFKQHLDDLWAKERPHQLGWQRTRLDELHEVIMLPAKRKTGEIDPYYIRLGGEYYDAAPPTVAVVSPNDWAIASEPSRWFPKIDPKPPWFGLHSAYQWPDSTKRQLVCFTLSAEFYMTAHSPKESELWQQGRHTLAATLFRLSEVLSPSYYKYPSDHKGTCS
jgi:hypothetical protein